MTTEPSVNPEIEKLRHEIDVTDNVILQALKRRFDIVAEVGRIKREEGLDAHQPTRQAQMMGNLQLQAVGLGLDPKMVETIWTVIHDASVRAQDAAFQATER